MGGLDWIGLDYGMPNPERGQSPFARRLMGAVGDGRTPALERYQKIYLINRLAGSQSVALAKRPFFPC